MLKLSCRSRTTKRISRAVGLAFLIVFSHSLVFAQQSPVVQTSPQAPATTHITDQTAAGAQARVSLAVSSPDYPVTPGDVYTLSYYQPPNDHVSEDLLVNGNWEINLGVFGKIDARGLTFVQLKQKVEKIIAAGYSQSLPSLRIKTPGLFSVEVTGEVDRVQFITAWGLTKLSSIVERAKDQYSSIRNVEVRTESGGVKRYDLFKAIRLGETSQNPYVTPGETIVLVPRGRTVTLSGQVRHPGTYELLPGEGLRDLIQEFGGGTTFDANLSRILIERNSAAQPHVVYVSIPDAYTSHVRLFDGDAVVVTSRAGSQSVVWLEGAVSPPSAAPGAAGGPQTETAGLRAATAASTQRPSVARIPLPMKTGELLSYVVQKVGGKVFLPTANLAAASLLRAGATKSIKINLAEILANPGSPADIPLRPNDTIFVPSLPSTVSVYGAVMSPGFFAWESGEPASYYIGLAGGVNPDRNARGKFSVTNVMGKRQKPKTAISPGDHIYVPYNKFGYRLSLTLPTILSVVGTVLSTASFIYLITR